VELLYAQGEDAAVSGVKAGDRVVLDGRQNLRPGAAVVERPREGGGGRGGKGAGAAASGASSAAGVPGAAGSAARAGKEPRP
jgi:hypothetical protein